MSEKILGFDVNLDFDEASKPFGFLDRIAKLVENQVEDLQAMGLEITKLHIVSPDAPVRFFVKFPKDKQQWEVRKALEQKGYDVGQKLGLNELAFYVTKRLVQSKGWET